MLSLTCLVPLSPRSPMGRKQSPLPLDSEVLLSAVPLTLPGQRCSPQMPSLASECPRPHARQTLTLGTDGWTGNSMYGFDCRAAPGAWRQPTDCSSLLVFILCTADPPRTHAHLGRRQEGARREAPRPQSWGRGAHGLCLGNQGKPPGGGDSTTSAQRWELQRDH